MFKFKRATLGKLVEGEITNIFYSKGYGDPHTTVSVTLGGYSELTLKYKGLRDDLHVGQKVEMSYSIGE